MKLGWQSLNGVGKNKLLSSSYFWLVFAPLAAKLTNNIDSIVIILNSKEYTINLTLPFSWQCFYFSALFVAIGKTIYELCCPRLVKYYQSPKAYFQEGMGNVSLIDNLILLKSKITESDFSELIKIFCIRFYGRVLEEKDLYTARLIEERQGDAFQYLYEKYNEINAKSFWAAVSFYILGAIMALIVVAQNTISVYNTF